MYYKFLIAVVGLFTYPTILNAGVNENSASVSDNTVIYNNCRVNVDCDGDGTTDLTAVVDCENAGAMVDQFLETCNG